MVHRLAQEAQTRHPQVRFIGLTERKSPRRSPATPMAATTRQVRDQHRLGAESRLGHLDRLTAGRDPVGSPCGHAPERRPNSRSHPPAVCDPRPGSAHERIPGTRRQVGG